LDGALGSPLQAASIHGHLAVVDELLTWQPEIDVNQEGGYYGTALQAAALYSHSNIVERLIQRKANVNAQCGTFGIAVQAAAYRDDWTIVEYLLDSGANINSNTVGIFNEYHRPKRDGTTYDCKYGLLHFAVLRDREEQVKALLSRPERDIDLLSSSGTLLAYTAWMKQDRMVSLLLDRSADVNMGHILPLLASIRRKEGQMTKLLLARGALVSSRDSRRWTPLHQAASHGFSEEVKMLITQGGDVTATDVEAETPLHKARNPVTVRLLLDAGADVHAKDRNGHAPLHTAMNRSDHLVATALLDKGADIEARSHEGHNTASAPEHRCFSSQDTSSSHRPRRELKREI
jgi:ankyrin repeat protein